MSDGEAERPAAAPHLPRMEPLARLPLFFALAGKRALVAGDGPGVAWKAELLSAAGADVEVFAPRPCSEIRELVAQTHVGTIRLHQRTWKPEDFDHAAIAVGGFAQDGEAERFARAARGAGVSVNVIDKPAYCDFSFGAIVNRSPLVVGISTDGAAPIFAQAIRAKLEAMIPRGFAQWVETARRWRRALHASGLSFGARRRFWEMFTTLAVTNPDHEPKQCDFEDLMERTREQATAAVSGCVTLVGAGPGDPELLTLRALRALQSADIILFDDLVAREILDFARREAKKLLVREIDHGPSCGQDEINALTVALAKSGKRVVRLKGGDPMIFGRAAEEIAACRAAGVPLEVVPGISAAQAAAVQISIPAARGTPPTRQIHYS
jgi:uroporphyrin-III C-methyltransferase / precorrin-2 dehydrogenase / sirohydrochlorin ferrochelatase